jgi:hypothetical protein
MLSLIDTTVCMVYDSEASRENHACPAQKVVPMCLSCQ